MSTQLTETSVTHVVGENEETQLQSEKQPTKSEISAKICESSEWD